MTTLWFNWNRANHCCRHTGTSGTSLTDDAAAGACLTSGCRSLLYPGWWSGCTGEWSGCGRLEREHRERSLLPGELKITSPPSKMTLYLSVSRCDATPVIYGGLNSEVARRFLASYTAKRQATCQRSLSWIKELLFSSGTVGKSEPTG